MAIELNSPYGGELVNLVAERTQQLSPGTVAQVHRGRPEEGRGVGVLRSTGEAGEPPRGTLWREGGVGTWNR